MKQERIHEVKYNEELIVRYFAFHIEHIEVTVEKINGKLLFISMEKKCKHDTNPNLIPI